MPKVIPENRPKRFSIEVVKPTARKIALKLMELPDMEEGGEEIEDDVIKAVRHAYSIDAYKIAKQLDYLGWDVDEEIVSTIDSCAHIAQTESINEATKKWIKDNNYEPRFEVGDTVMFRHPKGQEEFGEIVKVYSEMMRYLIYCEHLGHIPEGKGAGVHGTIINDEEVIGYVTN